MIPPSAILDAAERLHGVAHRTPVLTSRTLDEVAGCHVFLKCENFQRVGAFKFRGAYNAISRLSDAERAAGVITHSSGNHAQGIALAASLLGVPAVVVMPEDAPPNKRAATEGYGARIVPCDALHREEVTAALIAEHGYTLVHPFDNDDIIAGQGTAALELFDEVGPLDYLFVPVGGGGLISGSALAAQVKSPACIVVGVEPARGADANQSWREGRIAKLERVPDTIADGLRTRAVGQRNLEIMRRFVGDMTTVAEDDILAALEFVWSRLKIVIEPSAAVALAPLFSGSYHAARGKRVGVLLSGGNVDVASCGFFHHKPHSTPARESAADSRPSPPTARKADERPRVLLMTPLVTEAMEELGAAADIESVDTLDEEALMRRIGDAHGLIVGAGQRISSHVLKYGNHLRAIGLLGERLDHIDVSMARALGIEVVAAPNTRAVAIAEHTVSRMLTLATRYGDGRLAGKTLGLIGFGVIGRLVARRALAFDMRVLANQPRLTPELALADGVEVVDLVDLLRRSDFISLHVPFRAETETIIGEGELQVMKPGALLINTGHTDLVDERALLAALEAGTIPGAAVSALPHLVVPASPAAMRLREHPRVIVEPHVTAVIDNQQRDASLQVVRQMLDALQSRRANEVLALEVVPVEQVMPHEHIDQKRVARLMGRLEEDGRLVNPPITTYWKGRYVILDGATRYSALQQLGYPYAIVQVVQAEQSEFQLHTWYHAISVDREHGGGEDAESLIASLRPIPNLLLEEVSADHAREALHRPETICYFQIRDGRYLLARHAPDAPELPVMNAVVDTYNAWGSVERTLLTDLDRLTDIFPDLVAVAIYPQFSPEEVFDAAAGGNLLPAGLTRFVIPGRILRLNADLARLKADEPLADKRAWFNEFLVSKLSRSRLRYYQEPVVLLDE
jgi:threonine dehydratase